MKVQLAKDLVIQDEMGGLYVADWMDNLQNSSFLKI